MAEFQHDPVVGVWFFQAVPTGNNLDRMTRNTRAAHWNKPRGVRYRDTADLTTFQSLDEENTFQLLLSGVRVIRGPTQNQYFTSGNPADVVPGLGGWYGDPQLFFPIGPGLAPYTRRPVVTCHMVAMEIIKTSPVQSDGTFHPLAPFPLEDYTFHNWFGGIDWSAASGVSPDGVGYDVNQLEAQDEWPRAVAAKPIITSHTGQRGPEDLHVGLRFRILFGRVGGVFEYPGDGIVNTTPVPGGYLIHFQAMGPVAAY